MALADSRALRIGSGAASSEFQRVLIVTGSTGQGHNSVAFSLREAIDRQGGSGVRTEVLDVLGHGTGGWIGGISRLYAPVIVHLPRLWGLVYSLSNRGSFGRMARATTGWTWGRSLPEMLRTRAPQVVVSVHPLCTQMLAQGRRGGAEQVPLVTVITDLEEAHSAWVAPEVSLYLAPTAEIGASLLARGVSPRKVLELGLPVASDFGQCALDPRNARRELGLQEDVFTVLLTGGGAGAGAMAGAAQAIARSGLPVQLLIACGQNDGLHLRLSRASLPVTHRLFTFCRDVPRLMEAADVVIGKAGALTIGEAVAARRPVVLLGPQSGQERRNAEFARRHGIAAEAESPSALVPILKKWVSNPYEMKRLVSNGEVSRQSWLRVAVAAAATILGSFCVREGEEWQLVSRR